MASDNQRTDDIVEIARQRLADGRRVADHDVLRLIGIICAYQAELGRLKQELNAALADIAMLIQKEVDRLNG